MLSKNPVVQYFRLRLYPSLARLFGRRRRLSSLCLFLTLFLCALLLFSLSFTFAQNIVSMTALEKDFDAYITTHGVTDSNQLFRESVRVVLAHAELEIFVTHICLLLIWFLIAWVAVHRVFKEAVAAEKYVYALYVIYGADTRQLRKNILREFWSLTLPAVLLAIPLGTELCKDATSAIRLPLVVIAEVIVAFILLSFLCAYRISKQILSESCVKLMSSQDTAEYISSPRPTSLKHTLKRKNALGLSLLSFGRMRSYRFSQALTLALIGSILFSVTALTLPDNYATEETSLAYILSFKKGVSYEKMENDYLPTIESLEAVVRTERQVSDSADRLGTHLLLQPRQVENFDDPDLLALEDKWALDTVKIACGDGVTEKELGEQTVVIPEKYKDRGLTKLAYTLDTLRTGEAVYVYPEQNGAPKIQIGDTVEIAIPDGIEGYDRYGDHITLEITEVIPIGWVYTIQTFDYPIIEPVCPRIFEDYLFLSPNDYAEVSGIPQTTPTPVSEADAELFRLAENTCYLLLPESMEQAYGDLAYITVISPNRPIKRPYTSKKETDGNKSSLPTDTYFINDTFQYTGIYLGEKGDYASSSPAVNAMDMHMESVLDKEKGDAPIAIQYPVAGRSFCQGLTVPCVIFVCGDRVSFTSLHTELSAMQLKPSTCMDKALYWMDKEATVLTSDDNSAYDPGTTILLTTELPPAFLEAMEQAEVSLNAPEKKYGLTESHVVTAFQKGNRQVLILSFIKSSLAERDRYPISIDGMGSYLPINDRLADSVLTLADIDSMLVFQGDPKEERDHANILQGDFAINHFTLTTEREAGLSPKLSAKEAVLVLPENHPYALKSQDLVHIAYALPLTLSLTQMDLQGVALLAHQLEVLEHSYLPLILTSVQTDTSLNAPMLVVSEETFCQISGREEVISSLGIYVNSHSSLEALAELSETLARKLDSSVTLDTHHAVLKSRATGSQRYPVMLRTMLLPLCSLLILLPLSSAHTLELRREKERSAYIAAGIHRKTSFALSLGEGIWASLLGCGLYTLFCPAAILLLKLFCGKFHVPLRPESFSITAFILIFILILLSAMGTALFSPIYARALSKDHSSARKKGEFSS